MQDYRRKNQSPLGSLLTIIVVIAGVTWSGGFPIRATDYYVDGVNGHASNTGLSWDSSFRTISSALETCSSADVIHVAESNYSENLTLKAHVTVLGGYPQGGGDRAPSQHLTIIDGGAAGRCVFGAEAAILDGLILRNGRAPSGGGIQHDYISMTVRHCIIQDCVAFSGNPQGGGAMHFVNSQSLLEDCLFENNLVDLDPDAGSSEGAGGAVLMWSSTPTFINCRFRSNAVQDVTNTRVLLGGGVWCIASAPTFRGCVFEANFAMYGGGIGWWNKSTPLLDDCQFLDNTATESGGGIAALYSSTSSTDEFFTISDCVLQRNCAFSGGGIAALRNVKLILANCLITDNQARQEGGGVIACLAASLEVTQCTIADNDLTHYSSGAGIAIGEDSNVYLHDTIVAFNRGGEGLGYDGSCPLQQIRVEYCDFYGHELGNYSFASIDRTGVAGNLSVDPLFTLDLDCAYCLSEPATGDQTQIQRGRSPCINAGSRSTFGLHQGEGTTRTDAVKDSGTSDLGYHYFPTGPYLGWCSPDRFEENVAADSSLTCHVRARNALINPDSVSLKVNGRTVTPLLTPLYLGYEVRYQPELEFAPCEIVIVEVSAATLQEPPAAMDDELYQFTIAGCTPTPKPSPTPVPAPTSPLLWWEIPKTEFYASEVLHCGYGIYNPSFTALLTEVHVALEVAGSYYFFPYWDAELHPLLTYLGPGEYHVHEVLYLTLPPNLSPSGPLVLYAAAVYPTTVDLWGEVAAVAFEFMN